ncbi:glycosyltransferase family 4 protein [Wocania ichthyoenteri]|uniref:glycosyltransferase family 4 protein n=1 Tax=Wocania ichthyoenteri TaxID=1230531 RepID=UPI00053EDD47|nr:glycosyltransferase family 4 protein [Wocania ichthyoenteri]
MKIVFYTDQTYLHGGIEKVISLKSNHLSEIEGVEVLILTNEQKKNKPCYYFDNKIKHIDLGINYNRKTSNLTFENIFKVYKNFLRIRTFLRKNKPDVLVVCNYNFDYFFLPFLRKKTLKIKEIHDSRFYPLLRRKANKSIIKKVIYKISDWIESKYNYVVVLTLDEKKYYKGKNVKVIPNFIPNKKTFSVTNKKENVAISAGRISPVKGFDQLINAWKSVANKHNDWQLHIYGEGEENYVKYLSNLITDLGLSNFIKLKGSTSKLQEKMNDASFYVMSSITECFPMVLLESMQVGLPIISFDCPHGPKNIITDKVDGILVENKNLELLSKEINFLIENPEIRKEFAKNAQINVKRFDENLVMNDWMKLFVS